MTLEPRLLNAGAATTWQNLGDWSHAHQYPEAAEALAVRLGAAVGLSFDDRVADVGCGNGDQLLVWRNRFGVRSVTGYEPYGPSADRASTLMRADSTISVVRGSDASLIAEPTDVVLSLDAAYHFRSRAAFLERAAAVLEPGGRLGMMDLFVPGHGLNWRARMFAFAAGIPQRNLWALDRWRRELTAAGFVVERIEDLTPLVLGGFSRHAGQLSLRGRWPIDRLKVWVTAWVAAHAVRFGWLGFGLVVGRRERGGLGMIVPG